MVVGKPLFSVVKEWIEIRSRVRFFFSAVKDSRKRYIRWIRSLFSAVKDSRYDGG